MVPNDSDVSLAAYRAPLKSSRRPHRWSSISSAILDRVLKASLFIFAFLVVAMTVWKYPQWLVSLRSIPDVKERLLVENEMFRTALQMAGGAFLLAGLYFTWRNTYLLKEGQITERFNKAIDHLGDDKTEVRLGGIYALARIAKDSPKDHWPIMQVLCAFARNRSKTSNVPDETVATDVQAVLAVLGDRCAEYESPEQWLDLRRINLNGADLRGAFLDRTRFDESSLDCADLMRASLVGADFRGASLRKAHFRQAQLDRANFLGADLRDASLREARLRNANVLGAKLDNTTLIGADLVGLQYATRDQISVAITDETTKMPVFLEVSQASN
jgi:hypothetical protein